MFWLCLDYCLILFGFFQSKFAFCFLAIWMGEWGPGELFEYPMARRCVWSSLRIDLSALSNTCWWIQLLLAISRRLRRMRWRIMSNIVFYCWEPNEVLTSIQLAQHLPCRPSRMAGRNLFSIWWFENLLRFEENWWAWMQTKFSNSRKFNSVLPFHYIQKPMVENCGWGVRSGEVRGGNCWSWAGWRTWSGEWGDELSMRVCVCVCASVCLCVRMRALRCRSICLCVCMRGESLGRRLDA